MEQKIVHPDDYEKILLTDVVRDWNVWQEIRFQYQIGHDLVIKPVLLAPSIAYDGLLVIDGNHRVIAIGELEGANHMFFVRKRIEKNFKDCVKKGL